MKNSRTVTVSIFGGDPETRQLCTKCDTLIYTGPDLIGRVYDWCSCTGEDQR